MENLIVDAVRALGPAGVGLLMLLENVFPPVPSEFIMPLAGYLAARDELNLPAAIAAGTAGSLLGATLWYVAGRRVTQAKLERWVDRHGRWLTICAPDLRRAERFFERHGVASVLLGRLVPVVRTLISLPAGVTHMAPAPFLLFTALGSAVWTAALTLLGYGLGRSFPRVGDYVGVATWILLGGAALWYGVRVIRMAPRGAGGHE